MLSEHVFTIFHRSISISDRDVAIAAATAITCILIWAALHVYRSNVVVLHHAGGVDHLVQELSRIADALERIANQPAERALAAANRRERQRADNTPVRGGVSYSMFAR